MEFTTYTIQSKLLKPYIQYILFNQNRTNTDQKNKITSFANANICLGILYGKKIVENKYGHKDLYDASAIHYYLSGLYLKPFEINTNGFLDEICIDFTPLGYYKFFSSSLKTFISDEALIIENFGKSTNSFFEKIFNEADLNLRGALIETYLISKLKQTELSFLQQTFELMHKSYHLSIFDLCKKLNCTEKKLYRHFTAYFDTSPKEYLRIVRFRNAISKLLQHKINLTSIAYESEYFDQSHFIREFKFFTGSTPGSLSKSLLNIDNNV
ncbi:MAG TPA: helix-turn-helix domain-containing protein, partial [Saprospiraceae bacterium]|nr:helix-turn-helix domain-containing protein [Saprospiraceae bacterium]